MIFLKAIINIKPYRRAIITISCRWKTNPSASKATRDQIIKTGSTNRTGKTLLAKKPAGPSIPKNSRTPVVGLKKKIQMLSVKITIEVFNAIGV